MRSRHPVPRGSQVTIGIEINRRCVSPRCKGPMMLPKSGGSILFPILSTNRVDRRHQNMCGHRTAGAQAHLGTPCQILPAGIMPLRAIAPQSVGGLISSPRSSQRGSPGSYGYAPTIQLGVGVKGGGQTKQIRCLRNLNGLPPVYRAKYRRRPGLHNTKTKFAQTPGAFFLKRNP